LASPNLDRGKFFEILKTSKQNAAKMEAGAKARVARKKAACKNDLKALHKMGMENEKSEFTITRHVNSNVHATKKNTQYIDRSKEELEQYEALRNLLKVNKQKFEEYQKKSILNIVKVIELVKNGRKLLKTHHKAAVKHAAKAVKHAAAHEKHAVAHGKHTAPVKHVAPGKKSAKFIEVESEFVTGLSEIRVEFANTFDNINGLRPIISSLFQTMADANKVGKEVIRNRLLRLLHEIIKVLNKRKDDLEARSEGANAVFEALLKGCDENKTRVQKLQERLAGERNSLNKRQGALSDSKNRAHNITQFSRTALAVRGQQCIEMKERHAKLMISIQKSKNIVAQIEEILQERFGQLKGFFIERKMKLLKTE